MNLIRAKPFEAVGKPPVLRKVAVPVPAAGQVLVRVDARAVCRTDLHIIDVNCQI